MLRSYHVIDPTTVALMLRSGIVLLLKWACCLWVLFGGAALVVHFRGGRASWLGHAHRIAGDTRLRTHKTDWLLRRILAPMLVALLLLSSAASGNNQVVGKPPSTVAPKSKSVALASSLIWTLVPAAVGGAMMLHGQRISPINFGQGSGQTNDTETLIGLGIGSLGVVLGPGAGHAYAGRMGKFWGGAAIRGLVAPLAFAGAIGIAIASESDESVAGSIVLVVGAGTLFLTSVVYDIATVGRSVDQYNRNHSIVGIRFEPGYIARYNAPALCISVRF